MSTPEAVVAQAQAQYGGLLAVAYGAYSGHYYVIGVLGVRRAANPGALAALAKEYAAAIERWRAARPPVARPTATCTDLLTPRSAA